jgi:hypothetical protein
MSKRIMLKPFEALNISAIEGSCLISETNDDDFVLVFEGHQKRLVSVQMTKNILLKLKNNIDLYFKGSPDDQRSAK